MDNSLHFTLLYTEDEGAPLEVLGSFTEDVVFALLDEYERSGLLCHYEPMSGRIHMRKPVYVQVAEVVSHASYQPNSK